MKRINYLALGIICSSLFCGCVTTYESKKVALLRTASPQDWGSPPHAVHKAMEKEVLLATLKDPSSAQLKWNKLSRNVIRSRNSNPQLVWLSIVNVNAKNSFGGYTGSKQYKFAYVDGELFAISEPETYRSWDYVR